MRTLEWHDLFAGEIRLRMAHSKNRKPRVLPLRGELAEIIERARERRRPDCRFVFHLDGQPIGSFRKSWAIACKKAQLPGLLVHDLRRSAVRSLIRAGVSQTVAMKLPGHRSAEMFRRYDITSADDLAAAIELTSQHLTAISAPSNVLPLKNSHKRATV
jgi:integrase